MVKSKRESNRGPRSKGWTKWKQAMVPKKDGAGRYKKRNNGHYGYFCTAIRTVYDRVDCGIYEMKAVPGPGAGRKHYVVYVGCTHRKTPKDLKKRILEYCKKGSHKREIINEVLKAGYELHFRVKPIKNGSREDAETAENKLLRKYNYAWNKRSNRPYRGKKVPPRN